MTRQIIGLYFVHENEALKVSCTQHCLAFAEAGYKADPVNLADAEDMRRFKALLDEGNVEFCFGPQGIGSNLEIGQGINLWQEKRIPFIALHHDHPCHNPFNHLNASRYVANAYYFESFLETKQQYLPSNQLSGLVPFKLLGTLPPATHAFKERPIRLMYMKSGSSLNEHDAYIDSLPDGVRKATRARLDRLMADPNLQICDMAGEIFHENGLDRTKSERSFWGLVQTMDIWLRNKRAIEMVEWLKFQEGAVIIGNGWDFIDKTGARAEFRNSISLYAAGQIFQQTQFVCNTNPYGRDIIHERLGMGMIFGACVISDTNAWIDQHLSDVSALTRFHWNVPLDQQILPALAAESPDHYIPAAEAKAKTIFMSGISVQPIIDLAKNVRAFAA